MKERLLPIIGWFLAVDLGVVVVLLGLVVVAGRRVRQRVPVGSMMAVAGLATACLGLVYLGFWLLARAM